MDVLHDEAPAIDIPSRSDFYDDLLGTLLWSFRGPSPNRLLAVMTQAIRSGEPSNEVRQWLLTRFAGVPRGITADGNTEPEGSDEQPSSIVDGAMDMKSFADLVNSGSLWAMYWRKADDEVHRSTENRRALVGRSIYAGLLAPLPYGRGKPALTYKAGLGMRTAVAAVGVATLSNERGWDSVIMSRPRLATTLGWSIPTAGSHLNGLCELGLLSRQSAHSKKFRFRDPRKRQQHEIEQYAASMDALLTGEPDQIAAVIQSVTHPAWGYSSTLNHGHWLLLLANVAGVSPELYVMTPRLVGRLQRTLDLEVLIPGNVPRNLTGILDLIAASPEHGPVDTATGERISPLVAYERAETKWREGADKRMGEEIPAREEKRRAYLEEQKRKAEVREKSGDRTGGKSRRRSDEDAEVVTPVSAPAEVALSSATEKAQRVIATLLESAPVPSKPEEHNALEQAAVLSQWLLRMSQAITGLDADADFNAAAGTALRVRIAESNYGAEITDAFVAFIVRGEAFPPKFASLLAS